MKRLIHTCTSLFSNNSRPLFIGLALVSVLWLTACNWNPLDNPTNDAINEIEKTRMSILKGSDQWRAELPKLEDTLNGIAIDADASVKGAIADSANQVASLSKNTIDLSAVKASDLIHEAGSQFDCNETFVADGAADELQYIEDQLRAKLKPDYQIRKPIHRVCAITPSSLSLKPSAGGWVIDPSTLTETNIVHIWGYDFRPDALPALELQNDISAKLRPINVNPAYSTPFLINLDFSKEDFHDINAGYRIQLDWPDKPDPNIVPLVAIRPSHLTLSNPLLSQSPVVQGVPVSLKVTVTNDGEAPLQTFRVTWEPGSVGQCGVECAKNAAEPLQAGESRDFNLGPVTFTSVGTFPSAVTLSTESPALSVQVTVQAPSYKYYLDHSRDLDVAFGGGGGGDEFELPCPDGFVMTGIDGTSGYYINQVSPRCSYLESSGALTNSTNFDIRGKTVGSANYPADCAPGQAITTITGSVGDVVNQIQVHCNSISNPDEHFDTGSTGQVLGSRTPEADCPAGSFVTKLFGKAGDLIDQLNITCTPIVKQ